MATIAEQTVYCGDCELELPIECVRPGAPELPCRGCGSTLKLVKLGVVEELGVEVHDSMRAKLKDPSLRSKDKLRRDLFAGSDERKSVGDFVQKERDIDKDNDRYRERIVDKAGNVLRDVDQPLSIHQGHGSAKFKKLDKPADTEHSVSKTSEDKM